MEIPSGPAGIRHTLKCMADLAKQYRKAPAVRELALSIVRNIPNKNWAKEAAAIQSYVRDTIRYTRDILGCETLQTPVQTLRLRQGDCDDHSILVSALLGAIGHPTRFVAVGFSPGNYSHVFTETKIGQKWLALETTENWRMGQKPRGVRAVMVEHVK